MGETNKLRSIWSKYTNEKTNNSISNKFVIVSIEQKMIQNENLNNHNTSFEGQSQIFKNQLKGTDSNSTSMSKVVSKTKMHHHITIDVDSIHKDRLQSNKNLFLKTISKTSAVLD